MARLTETAEVREEIVRALRVGLIGPWAGHPLAHERLPGGVRPSNWYLTGFLVPRGAPAEQRGDADVDDVPVDPDFHARRLPQSVWRHSTRRDAVEAVIQVHRLREVLALAGFTRCEPVMPNLDGDDEAEVERADIALEPAWFPAVENRGEGIHLKLRSDAAADWLGRARVGERLDELVSGHSVRASDRASDRSFPGGPYVLLHSLAHHLIQSLSMRCGYRTLDADSAVPALPSGGRY